MDRRSRGLWFQFFFLLGSALCCSCSAGVPVEITTLATEEYHQTELYSQQQKPSVTQAPPSLTPPPNKPITAIINNTTIQTIMPAEPKAGELRQRSRDGGIMVYVPSGEFEMGTQQEEITYTLSLCQIYHQDCGYITGSLLSRPVHTVYLDGFWIDQYEITNAQFAAFLNDQGNQIKGGAAWLSISNPHSLIERVNNTYQPKEGFAEHPVIEVTWYGADAYCQWAGVLLPTEAQWEYAARGPESLIFPWGNTSDLTRMNFCDTNCEKIWKTGEYETGINDGYPMTSPVGSYPGGKSWCGAMDLVGNVWEWVADWMGEYSVFSQENPSGPESGTIKVIKGGSWCNAPTILRSSHRWNYAPVGSGFNVGFRCAGP